ncbi:MAG TPA: GNAT family N-acetyltransferase [Acidimicrobiales bacterium]
MTAAAHPEESARPATPDDLPVVVELATAAIAEKREQKGGAVWARRERRPDPLDASLAAAIAADDQQVLVGLLDDAIVGFGAARVEVLADGGRLGVVDEVYVDPGARAVGVGEVLMDGLVAWCRDQGCFGVDSLALPGDRATKNFFESFGLVARAIVVHRPLT